VKAFLSGRTPCPADAQDLLLCGPLFPEDMEPARLKTLKDSEDKARRAFLNMISVILTTKEENERTQERLSKRRRIRAED